MIERHDSYAHYCGTPAYRRWLAQWIPPELPVTDVWHDSEVAIWDTDFTPRHHLRQRHGTRLAYHLLDSLAIQGRCVDIGCGDNGFRHRYPGIWGVDPYCEQDRDEQLTPEWWIHNWGQWPHAFSCNAMHFCTQAELPQQMAKVRGILAPGGTALVTINRQRIQDRTPGYDRERLYHTLSHTPGLTRMVWIDSPDSDGMPDLGGMDGNVWLWINK